MSDLKITSWNCRHVSERRRQPSFVDHTWCDVSAPQPSDDFQASGILSPITALSYIITGKWILIHPPISYRFGRCPGRTPLNTHTPLPPLRPSRRRYVLWSPNYRKAVSRWSSFECGCNLISAVVFLLICKNAVRQVHHTLLIVGKAPCGMPGKKMRWVALR